MAKVSKVHTRVQESVYSQSAESTPNLPSFQSGIKPTNTAAMQLVESSRLKQLVIFFAALILLFFLAQKSEAQSPEQIATLNTLYSELTQKGEVMHSSHLTTVHFKRGASFSRHEERDVSYITLAGQLSETGEFTPVLLSTVDEQWRKEGSHWAVRQKIRFISTTGKIQRVSESVLVFDENRMLVDSRPVPKLVTEGETSDEALFWNEVSQWIRESQKALPRVMGEREA